jgi:hypothetical protein
LIKKPPVNPGGSNLWRNFMAEATRAELEAWLASIGDYVMQPAGNQPDAFLIGIMKKPAGAKKEDIVELTEEMVVPEDYKPEKI